MKLKAVFSIALFLSILFQINAQNKEILWSEDFERDWYQDWHVDIGTWEVGTPTSGPNGAFTGNNCAATILNGAYPSNVETRLIRHTSFTVPPASENPKIRFWHWFYISNGDWGEVQVKTSKGDWKTVSPRFFQTGSDAWTLTTIDLKAYADSTIQIAFFFKSDGNYTVPGWYIDDVELIIGPQVYINREDFESGLGDWSVDRGSWEVGNPTSGPGSAYRGQNCAGLALNGNYHNNIETRLISPPFIVPSSFQNPAIRFWHWFYISNGDWGEVQVKTPQGEWATISPKYFQTGSDVWTRSTIELGRYADSTIQLAFFFKSDGNYTVPGWYIDDVELTTGPRVFNNPEDFELGLGDWSVDRGSWEVGIPQSGPSNAYGGQNCAGVRLDGLYHANLETRLVSPRFIVPSSSQNPAIQFWHWFSISNSDKGEIQISTDDGYTWETISNKPITTRSGSWSPFYIPLTSYAESQVRISFNFYSDGNYTEIGWYIDDVRILDNSELVVYAGPDVSRESGSTVTLNGNVSGGTEPYTIEWIPSDGLSDPSILNPVASPSDTTAYTLRITDDHGCFRTDRITVFANSENENPNDILSFNFDHPPEVGNAKIDLSSHKVKINVVSGTDFSNLIATFSLSDGATATVDGVSQVSGVTVNDFTNPVNYLITAVDGVTAQGWVVTVAEEAPRNNTDITSFGFGIPPQTGEAIVDPNTQTVDIKVEHGTDVTALVASFSIPEGASATVSGMDQQSGVSANDFKNPVTYKVTAADGITVQEWVVTVVVAALNEADFLTFGFGIPPQTGDAIINPVTHTVDIEVESGTDITALNASFTLSDGASAKVGEVDQESGVTATDFTNPVTYTITASDEETIQDWLVNVEVASTVGIESNSIHGLRIYPNPFSNKAVIEVNNPEKVCLNLSVFGVLGNKVFEQEILNSESVEFKKGNLSEGVYWVILRGDKILIRKAIVIE